ncbi:ABC transporter permease [Methanocalculus sp.]|uniref:ABC transporter permease n=1 Tax=Methanocalculus sp. TaxID=2004547 RepID=UPI0025DAD131|nr:ABC transporter permease [Methanocalculus sp.]
MNSSRPDTMRQRIGVWFGQGVGAFLILIVCLFLSLPLIALLLRVTPELLATHIPNETVQKALWLSITTAIISMAIVILIGTPTAYFHSRSCYPGKSFVDTLIDLPLVLPPAVAGLALLLLFGRTGLLGKYLNVIGIDIAFTTVAVILAQIFVASPFYIRQAKALFEQLDPAYEETAKTLGSSSLRTFLFIILPLCATGLTSGAIMTFARALGEFGATIMFAGNLPGITQTMPLAIYAAMQGDFDVAITISVLLVAISLAIMLTVKLLSEKWRYNV